MPTVIQIAKNISKGTEGKAFAQIGKTRCKNEEETYRSCSDIYLKCYNLDLML